jgi:hypothetical protein
MDLFYNKHGINPSPEFVSLYEQTVKDDRTYNVNFGILKGQLDDLNEEIGAFYCEFPFFKRVYQLEVRDAIRSDRPTHLCLITAVSKTQEELEPKVLNRVTGKLSECIKSSLRSRDVFSRYSASQFVLLLTNTTKEQAEMVLNRILKRFKKENPDVRVSISVVDSLRGWLENDAVDVVFGDLSAIGENEHIVIMEDPYVAVLPEGTLAGRRSVCREDLYPFPYISTNEGVLHRYFDEQRFAEILCVDSADDAAVLSLVKEGIGVAVLTALATRKPVRGIRTVKLTPAISRSIGFAYRKKTPAAERFIAFMRENSVK